MATYENVTYNSPDGALIGLLSTEKLGFYGATPVVQTSGAAQAELSPASLVTSLAGYGFYTATLSACLVAQVLEIRRTLVLLGLWKGAA